MLRISVSGLETVTRRLANLQKGPPKYVKDEVGKEGVKALKDNWNGNPLGWASLKAETVRRKGFSTILVGPEREKGNKKGNAHLKDQFKHFVVGDNVELRNADKKGPYHQFGTRRMVARKFMKIQDKWRKPIVKPIRDWLERRGWA